MSEAAAGQILSFGLICLCVALLELLVSVALLAWLIASRNTIRKLTAQYALTLEQLADRGRESTLQVTATLSEVVRTMSTTVTTTERLTANVADLERRVSHDMASLQQNLLQSLLMLRSNGPGNHFHIVGDAVQNQFGDDNQANQNNPNKK